MSNPPSPTPKARTEPKPKSIPPSAIVPEELPHPDAVPRINRQLLVSALLGGGTIFIVPVLWYFFLPLLLSIIALVCALVGFRKEKKDGGLTAINRDCFVTGLVTGGLGIAAFILCWFLHSKDFLP